MPDHSAEVRGVNWCPQTTNTLAFIRAGDAEMLGLVLSFRTVTIATKVFKYHFLFKRDRADSQPGLRLANGFAPIRTAPNQIVLPVTRQVLNASLERRSFISANPESRDCEQARCSAALIFAFVLA